MFCPNCGQQNADNAAFAALLSVVAIFALIDLFDILPARFKNFKYSKYLGFDGIMTTIMSIVVNVLLIVSSAYLAIGSWMTFASGMGMAQSGGKGISIAKNGAAMATASYVIVLLGDLIFFDLGDMDGSFVAGYIIAILLFILAMIGLEGNSLADNTDSVAGVCQLLAFGCIAVQGVVHVSTANKMK